MLSIVKEEDESPVHQVQDIIPTINVYPNPATKSLALKIENPEEYIFEIYDGAGNKMIVNTNNPNHIETDLLLPGLYIVKATNRSYDFTLYKSFIKI
ncbi:MAG: T9SS type A sorting domain-containing protein [Saprospiraceae bacterium]|nr:T9SS type A sorting domain-containing protein [Saprospiraceae bacterium]